MKLKASPTHLINYTKADDNSNGIISRCQTMIFRNS